MRSSVTYLVLVRTSLRGILVQLNPQTRRMTLECEPLAVDLTITRESLTVRLADGRSLTIPLAWYPRLVQATETERANWHLLGGGYAIEWPDLDEHMGITGLLAGHRSGESDTSFNRWVASRSDG